jgi:hypothetical protein
VSAEEVVYRREDTTEKVEVIYPKQPSAIVITDERVNAFLLPLARRGKCQDKVSA